MSRAVALLLAAGLLTGCSVNATKMIEQLSKSDRSWCLALTGYGADLKVGGSGVDTGDMTCGGSGLVLQSKGAQVGVPLTIVPQLSIGQPSLAPAPAPRAPRVVPQAAPAPISTAPVLRISAPAGTPTRGDLTDAEVRDVLQAIRVMHTGTP